jgi:hypothetical protein
MRFLRVLELALESQRIHRLPEIDRTPSGRQTMHSWAFFWFGKTGRLRDRSFWHCLRAVRRVAIRVHIPRTRFFVSPCIFSLCFLLILRWLSVSVDRHIRCNGGCCPYRRACRGVMFCVALKASVGCTCVRLYRCGVKTLSSMGCAMDSEPAGVEATDPVRRGLRG